MKILHVIGCTSAFIIVAVGLYNVNSGVHKNLGNAAVVNQIVDNITPRERPRNSSSRLAQTNSVNAYVSGIFQAEDARPRQEKARSDNSINHYSEKEMVALYSTDESIRAFALRALEDTSAARQILATAITDPSPKIRNSALERIIEFEDREHIAFQANVDSLLANEQDNEVIETALSYYSMTDDEATDTIVIDVIKRPNLSVDVLAYAGEILYKHYNMDKENIGQLLAASPSFAALDQSQIIQLEESLGEVFYSKDTD